MDDNELFDYLMTSDLHENWSLAELRSMILFFRNKVREIHGSKIALENEIEQINKKLSFNDRLVVKKEIEREEFEIKYNKLSERKLSFKERFFGKIIKSNAY